MSLHLSKVCENISQSLIRRMTLECVAVGGVNLSQGVCDIPVPAPVREALKQAVDEGFHTYTRYDGLESLRCAIAAKLAAAGIEACPDTEIVVTVGATGAFLSAAMALLDPGDEVLVFEPFYGYHVNCLKALGMQARTVPMEPPDWSFSLEELEAAVGPRTRAILVNTPANPTGKVFGRGELEALAAFTVRHDLFMITDEIYEYFLYDGREHLAPATLPGMRERTITISGFSKTLAITGWRIGYLFADARWTRAMRYCSDIAYVCAPSVLQEAVARGLGQLDASYYQDLCASHERKRQRICATLEEVGLPPIVPQGAYYVLADISRLPGTTSEQRVMHLLRETKVAAVPGQAFFADPRQGDGLARFCFAKTDEDLERACEGLRRLG